jgi:hypothetical protein
MIICPGKAVIEGPQVAHEVIVTQPQEQGLVLCSSLVARYTAPPAIDRIEAAPPEARRVPMPAFEGRCGRSQLAGPIPGWAKGCRQPAHGAGRLTKQQRAVGREHDTAPPASLRSSTSSTAIALGRDYEAPAFSISVTAVATMTARASPCCGVASHPVV